MPRQIFVNLPVKNLKRSIEFFRKLGFSFNPLFTDENAACMIISENIHVMLLSRKSFNGFIPGKEIADATRIAEVLVAVALESRNEVDRMIGNAVSAGGNQYRETDDFGWMYVRSFQDLDGHIWEILHMDESLRPL